MIEHLSGKFVPDLSLLLAMQKPKITEKTLHYRSPKQCRFRHSY
jgi:hypothetical protein